MSSLSVSSTTVGRLVLVFLLVGSSSAAAKPMEFGFAKVDITPSEPMRLSGYGNRKQPLEGVDEPLFARVMAFRQRKNGPLHVLASVDSLGISATFTQKVYQRLKRKHHLDRAQFVLCATHNHTAPYLLDCASNLFAVPLSPAEQAAARRYAARLADAVVEAADQAIDDLQPGRMFVGQGQATFAHNRRFLENGRCIKMSPYLDGPVDHSLPILKITDVEGRRIRGFVFNYACHCTTFGGRYNRVNGDWAGYAVQYVEKAHPEAVALCTIGCGADANPQRDRRRAMQIAQAQGREIAAEVDRVASQEMAEVTADVQSSFGYARLPIDRPSADELKKKLHDRSPQVRRHAQNMLAIIQQQGRLPATYPMPLQLWRFGDQFTMFFLGGEVVVDYALRIQREFPQSHVWVTAYANDVFGYVASERMRSEGGYEVDFSMVFYNRPGRWSTGTEALIFRRLHELYDGATSHSDDSTVRSPQRSATATDEHGKLFSLHQGFKIKLAAAEPLVMDPVAFDWGPDGKLWVVEMGDYPTGVGAKEPSGGRVRFLEDTDGDGTYDRSTLFFDKLPYPTGVKVWRKGVLVTAAPDIVYLEDTDGDGKADRRDVLFTGFGEGNPQHRVNGLRWGLDNWLYVANGDSGGTIRSAQTGQELDINGRDLRIRPDDGRMDALSGMSQFGLNRDDWGNWFGCSNSNPMWHNVLADRYLRRNSHVAAPRTRKDVSKTPGAARVFPTSRTEARFNLPESANRFTSACSVIVYRDTLFGPAFRGNSFVAEPVHNLVHREIMQPEGVSFVSQRAKEELHSEFLSSRDNSFRPTTIRTGPDGALWIADMYRAVIEHPEWIPDDWEKQLDLRAGHDKGRIYRVLPVDATPRPLVRLDRLDTAGLVAALESPNGWQRDMAQQMLLRQADPHSVELLEKLVRLSQQPLARLHALCTLDGLGRLRPDLIEAALRDPHPGVRRHAVRLAERFLKSTPSLNAALIALAEDADPQVQLQLACTLGYCPDARAGQVLGTMARQHVGNAFFTAAILSSVNQDNLAAVLRRVLADDPHAEPPGKLVATLLDLAVAYQKKSVLQDSLAKVASPGAENAFARWQFEALGGLLKAIAQQQQPLKKEFDAAGIVKIEALLAAARQIAANQEQGQPTRVAAIGLLGRLPNHRAQDIPVLRALLVQQTASDVQQAAVQSLAHTQDPRVPQWLLAAYSGESALRGQILDVLLSRVDWTGELLTAMETNPNLADAVDPARRQQLLSHRNEAFRQRAKKLFAPGPAANPQELVQRYLDVDQLHGKWTPGKALFAKHCSVCHRLEGVGHAVGPDLSALTDKSTPAMLTAILDPNRAVEDKFVAYAAVMDDGRVFTGMLARQDGNSITLRQQEGKEQVLLRENLEELVNTHRSLMPEGFEKTLSRQDLAHLLAYIRFLGPRPKHVPGNRPELVTAGPDGKIHLLASNCEIFGDTITVLPTESSITQWTSRRDYVAWNVDQPEARSYDVWIQWAADDAWANNRFILETENGPLLEGKFSPTASPTDYRKQKFGRVSLPAGQQRIVLRAAGPVAGELVRLRAIDLVPKENKENSQR